MTGWCTTDAHPSWRGYRAIELLPAEISPVRGRSDVHPDGGAARKYRSGRSRWVAAKRPTTHSSWISSARRGAASEIITARHDHLPDRLRAAGLGALADLGFTSLDPDPEDPGHHHRIQIHPDQQDDPAQRHANQALSAARAPVEHGFGDLKNWRILTRLRLSPANATTLLRALLVLTRRHTSR